MSLQETHQRQTDDENNAAIEQTRNAIKVRSNLEWKIFHSVLTLGALYQVFTHSDNSNAYNLTLNAFTLIEALLNAGLIESYNSTSNSYFTLALSTQTAFHLVNRNAKELLSTQLGSYYQMAATGINMSLAAFAVIQFFRSQTPRAKKLAAAIRQPNRHTA